MSGASLAESSSVNTLQKAKRHAKYRIRQLVPLLPGRFRVWIERRRHLAHVQVNQRKLIHPAFLSEPQTQTLSWQDEGLAIPLPASGLQLQALTAHDEPLIEEWLNGGPYDSDELLAKRLEGNHDDELGRLVTALRCRLALHAGGEKVGETSSGLILFDARSLQTSGLGTRGIGRFAQAALRATREAAGDQRCVLLVDPGLDELASEIVGSCLSISRVSIDDAHRYAALIQPSPMTANPEPLLPVLQGPAHSLAIVFDFIPARYPAVYLNSPADRAEYAARLDALRRYREIVGISHVALEDYRRFAGSVHSEVQTTVAWPRNIAADAFGVHEARKRDRRGPIVIATGDEVRKNTYGALAAVGAATVEESHRSVIVLGMSGLQTRVHHWSIAAVMRPGEARTLERVSDDEMRDLLEQASLVVVPSFDEGLSLPVIEALAAGTPVVASDIAAHRELLGAGSFLAEPGDIAGMSQAIRQHRGDARTYARQAARLGEHEHEVLEDVVKQTVARHRGAMASNQAMPNQTQRSGDQFKIAVATPWTPQRTGIADYSVATIGALSTMADVTVYTTADARVDSDITPQIQQRHVDDLAADEGDYDVVVSVIGNSHYHVPFVELLGRVNAVALAHDTRMVEFYTALRGLHGAQELMIRGQWEQRLSPPLDEQIDDLRLMQNIGFWEMARRSRSLITHSPVTAERITHETGVTPHVLRFANYRQPSESVITMAMREDARNRLGLSSDFIYLASFGYIDVRTKMSDVVIEAAAWLTQWGHPVALHLVGEAPAPVRDELTERAREAGIAEFSVTGFVDDEKYRDYLLGIDLGVQLRVSPLLGVSGPLADLAAYGTAALGSRGLTIDVGVPEFIEPLPDDVSPVILAEAIERRLASRDDPTIVEAQRQEYLRSASPVQYAQHLLALLRRIAAEGA